AAKERPFEQPLGGVR
ncbi:unnamed protein product, partial [Fusarium fujikuroi]